MKNFIIAMLIWSIICLASGYQFKQSTTTQYLKSRKFILNEDRQLYPNEKELTKEDIEFLTGKDLQ